MAAHPTFTFYPAEIDGHEAAIVVDLAAEPTATHPYCVLVRVDMRETDPDGLRTPREMKRLRDVQELLTRRLGKALGARSVGFLDAAGATHFAFYAKRAAAPAELLTTLGKLEGYVPEVAINHDPDWAFFVEQLYPDAYALQGIVNHLLVHELAARGDALDAKREIDHAATFATPRAAAAAAKKLTRAGYRVDPAFESEDGRSSLTFHKQDALADDAPNLFCFEILDIVQGLAGEYDGWGAPLVPEIPAAKPKAEKKKPAAKPKKAEKKKPAAKPKKAEKKKPAAKPKKAEKKKPAARPTEASKKKPAAKPKKASQKKPAARPKKASKKKPATRKQARPVRRARA